MAALRRNAYYPGFFPMYSHELSHFLGDVFGETVYFAFAFSLYSIAPALLLFSGYVLLGISRPGQKWLRMVWGLGAALWASVCWATVPYCGGYPVLPSLIVLFVLQSIIPLEKWLMEVIVHTTSFALWISIGWALFSAKARLERSPSP